MKNKYLFLIVVFIFLANFYFCSALNIDFRLPGNYSDKDLPGYIAAVFNLVFLLSGAIAILALIISSFRYMFSGGSPESQDSAKKGIYSSLLGLVLLLSSIVIARTINPSLINIYLKITEPKPLSGVYLVSNDNSTRKLSPANVDNTSQLSPELAKIQFFCSEANLSPDSTTFLVRRYSGPLFTGNLTIEEKKCNDEIALDRSAIKSYNVTVRDAGIFLYTDPNCQYTPGNDVLYVTSSQPTLPDNFKGKVKCVKIINDVQNKVYYAAILHQSGFRLYDKDSETGDISSGLLITGVGQKQQNWPYSQQTWSSVSAFRINLTAIKQDSVKFYSEPLYNGGSGIITPEELLNQTSQNGYYTTSAGSIQLDFPANTTPEQKSICINSNYPGRGPLFLMCPGSISFVNSIVAVCVNVFDPASGGMGNNCQIFRSAVQSLGDTLIGQKWRANLNLANTPNLFSAKIYIIPAQQ